MSGSRTAGKKRADHAANDCEQPERSDHEARVGCLCGERAANAMASVIAPNTSVLRNATTRPISSIGVISMKIVWVGMM